MWEPSSTARLVETEREREEGERERSISPIQPHKADSGAARTSPGRSQKITQYASTQRRSSLRVNRDVNKVQVKEAIILAEAWPTLANKRQRETNKQACGRCELVLFYSVLPCCKPGRPELQRQLRTLRATAMPAPRRYPRPGRPHPCGRLATPAAPPRWCPLLPLQRLWRGPRARTPGRDLGLDDEGHAPAQAARGAARDGKRGRERGFKCNTPPR